MRLPVLFCLVTAATLGCGDDGGDGNVDAAPVTPPPRVIAGGGIGDGPIDGVANVYVIDDGTRSPISGATVRVGTVEGQTDGTGLFVAEGVTGPQTVIVKAGTYRAEMWVGANGTNMTFNLSPGAEATPASATLSGTVDLSSITVAAGHLKLALVFYSQTDDIGDADNEIPTADGANVCNTGLANNQPCTYSIEARTGKVALLAAVFDRDLKGTPANPDDDTQTLIGWASRTGITVTGGVDQTGQDLTLVDVGMLGNVTVDFGSPPSGLNTVGAIIGIDLGADGVFQIPLFRTPTDPTLLTPKLAAFSATGYRLTAIANSGDAATAPNSIVLRRGLTASPLPAGTWLTPPANATATRTSAAWTAVAGATVHSVQYTQGTASLLNITVFDSTTQVTIPELVSLPLGMLRVEISAIGAAGLDVNNFSLDAESDKLAQVTVQPVLIN